MFTPAQTSRSPIAVKIRPKFPSPWVLPVDSCPRPCGPRLPPPGTPRAELVLRTPGVPGVFGPIVTSPEPSQAPPCAARPPGGHRRLLRGLSCARADRAHGAPPCGKAPFRRTAAACRPAVPRMTTQAELPPSATATRRLEVFLEERAPAALPTFL